MIQLLDVKPDECTIKLRLKMPLRSKKGGGTSGIAVRGWPEFFDSRRPISCQRERLLSGTGDLLGTIRLDPIKYRRQQYDVALDKVQDTCPTKSDRP